MDEGSLRRLGQNLRELRTSVGWSGKELASRAGVSQPTVSRVENGLRVASVDAVVRIVDALPMPAEHAEALRTKAHECYAATVERRIDAGYSFVAETMRKLVRDSSSVRGFQSAAIPRHLRTAEYAQAAGARGADGYDSLSGGERDFHFVVTEGALRTWPASRLVVPFQLDYLLSVLDQPNVRLGLIPWSRELPMLPPHGFSVLDGEAVVVETFTAQMTITEPDAVAAYVDAYAQLEAVAVTGDEAAELLRRIRRDFEDLAH